MKFRKLLFLLILVAWPSVAMANETLASNIQPTCSFQAFDDTHIGVRVLFSWSGLPEGESGTVLVYDPSPNGSVEDFIVIGWSGSFEVTVPYSNNEAKGKAIATLDSKSWTPPECRYQAPLPPWSNTLVTGS